MARTKHKWRFFRAGGFDQVRLDTGGDLMALGELDQKLWVALACPTRGLELDRRTLELVDADGDGRIRAPEVIAAVKWAASHLVEGAEALVHRKKKLPLSAIDTSTEEGARLHASAKRILHNLGKEDATDITVDDTADTERLFARARFNGDGIVPAASAEDPAIARAIEDVMACVGSEEDRSGAPGVSLAKLDGFVEQAGAYDAWWKNAESDAANVLPLGEATAGAAKTFGAAKAKIDDYFTRCRLAAFDARAAAPLNREQAEYAALATKELTADAAEVAALPLSHVEADRALPLDRGLNPAWSAAVGALREQVIVPLVGERASLTAADWASVSARFAAYEAWSAAAPDTKLKDLGVARVRELLADDVQKAIRALIAEDQALHAEFEATVDAEKLVRFHRDLHALCTNFVSFRDFYSRNKGIFQAGRLYVDGRSCDLCVRVPDVAVHATLAALSSAFLVYCECTRKGDASETMSIVAAVTAGEAGFLMVGRHCIFYDREGKDWDAVIVKMVEQPISVREAFWIPYRRLGKFIGEQIEKFAASRDKDIQARSTAQVTETATDATAAAAGPADAPAKEPFDVGKFAGIFAAIGLALGAIGTALAMVLTGFMGLRWWQMPLAVAGVLFLVSGPSMLIAFLKLRRRSLGPILDASGWAVNGRARLNIPFGASLTGLATLPAGAQRSFDDPYADKKRGWIFWLLLLALAGAGVALWRTGHLRAWLARAARSSAPSASASAPAKPPK